MNNLFVNKSDAFFTIPYNQTYIVGVQIEQKQYYNISIRVGIQRIDQCRLMVAITMTVLRWHYEWTTNISIDIDLLGGWVKLTQHNG